MSFDFYGDNFKWFVGVVKGSYYDNTRVRVRIFGIHRMDDTIDVSDDDLQPAIVLFPTTGGQTSGGNLSHGLKTGTWVFGFFADGENCQQPVVVGVFNGGIASSSNLGSASPAGGSAGDGRDTGGGSNDTSVPLSTLGISGKNNAEQAYNMIYELIEKSGRSGGNIHMQVSGIMGNILAESNCNPSTGFDKPVVDTNGGKIYGICSWNTVGGRPQIMFRKYGQRPTLDQQISFMWDEFHSTYERAFFKIMAATTVDEATQAMCFYEQPACLKRNSYVDVNDSTYKPRIKYANQVYSSFKYTPRDTSAARGR